MQLDLFDDRAEWREAGGYDWTRCPRCGVWVAWMRSIPLRRLAIRHHERERTTHS